MKQKGLAPVLIILLIALGVGGYLLYQKQSKPIPQPSAQSSSNPVASSASSSAETASPDPDLIGTGSIGANWKTYTNKKIGYTIKYPDDYKLERESEDEVSFSGLFQPGNQTVPDKLVITTKITNLDSQLCQEGDISSPCISNKSESAKLDNKSAISFDLTYQGGGSNFSNRIQTTQNPRIEIYQTVYGGGADRLDQILSTFKFTN